MRGGGNSETPGLIRGGGQGEVFQTCRPLDQKTGEIIKRISFIKNEMGGNSGLLELFCRRGGAPPSCSHLGGGEVLYFSNDLDPPRRTSARTLVFSRFWGCPRADQLPRGGSARCPFKAVADERLIFDKTRGLRSGLGGIKKKDPGRN